MFAPRHRLLTAALGCLLAPASLCHAQAYGLEDVVANNDLRWFEPAELDLDGRIDSQAGFFFRYDKTVWAITGERIEIGSPGLTVASEDIFNGILTPDEENARNVLLQVNIQDLAVNGITPETISAFFPLQRVDPNDPMSDFVTVTVTVPVDDDTTRDVEVPQLDGDSDRLDAALSQYQVKNGILDATPDAEFAWGDRYEFGYSDGERGWTIGILDGPEAKSNATYGVPDTPYTSQTDSDQPGVDPAYEDNDIDGDGDGVLDGDGPQFGDGHFLGFGSVAVNFELPDPNFLNGFRDYLNNLAGAQAGTVYGPVYYVGNYGAEQEDSAGDDDTYEGAAADDLDGDLFGGSFFILADLNGDGTIDDDERIAQITDFDDLYTFNVFFDTVTTRNVTEMNGVEWMLTHQIDQSHRLEQGRSDRLQFSYGVRFLRLQDRFSMVGLGSILGRTSVSAEIDNQLVGPQLGLRWTRDRGKWDFSVDGRVMFAYNRADIDQYGVFGEEAIPGALNRSASARTTTSVYGKFEDDFSPLAELRLEARYKLTRALALKIGYTAQYVDNIQRASQSVIYRAPDFGVKDARTDILANGVNFGIEFRH
ncbi:BBP7 family outer membrane beta-barrel protein [Botrimarina hoheduenensis]|uniref:Uncharacterized protein n=1 Tax=Botrimarina hoheduenensis TaxID=2528000 RepID=A0A5C5VZR9_9BACT|nr:BBP7 family outer membrane beta-barrel protein [Botrimarina hoheduenensis]TWT43291.1 hypothetical protein Pla111_22420 [Botrimarina hoheduenensis]